jgi:hypothetical protein
MDASEKQKTIERNFCGDLIDGKKYTRPLPQELAEWYAYTRDGGHSICCVLQQDCRPGVVLSNHLIPLPVRTVLKDYWVRDDYIVIDVPYGRTVEWSIPEDDYEFDAGSGD